MKRFFSFFFSMIFLFLFISCKKIDVAPTYIIIEKEDIKISLENIDLEQFNDPSGLTAHDFSDIWLTANGKKIGTWELPCKIPILERGEVNLSIEPGIKLNGVSTTRPIYPFVQKYTETVKAQGNGTEIVIKPTFNYLENNLHFPLVENFESAGTSFISLDSTKPSFSKIDDPLLIYYNELDPNDGNRYSGWIQLKDSMTSFEIISPSLILPGNGRWVFLELNYNCEQDLNTGLFITQANNVTTNENLVMLRATKGKWKKAYINLTLAVSRNYTAQNFKVFLSGNKKNSEEANFYFDNIRVLTIY